MTIPPFYPSTETIPNKPVACKGSRMQLFLIAVMSRLDAVVACINVLHPIENQ